MPSCAGSVRNLTFSPQGCLRVSPPGDVHPPERVIHETKLEAQTVFDDPAWKSHAIFLVALSQYLWEETAGGHEYQLARITRAILEAGYHSYLEDYTSDHLAITLKWCVTR